MADVTAELVRAAHADAWQEEGRTRAAGGGKTAQLPGVRLMSSGLPFAQWNGGDVDDTRAVDVAAVDDWYAKQSVPWGLRVPANAWWPHGELLFRLRLMGLRRELFRPASVVPGLQIAVAEPCDLAAVVDVDTRSFGADAEQQRAWLAPHLVAEAVDTAVAFLDDEPVATGYTVHSVGRAGTSVLLGGVGVVPGARRRGIGAAVSTWLVQRGVDQGALLAHLHAEDDVSARVYVRLGFVEVDGLDVYRRTT